jgi:FHA domain
VSYAIRYGDRDFTLSTARLVLGRSEDCPVCLDDPMASRQHAAVFLVDGEQAFIEDLKSRNGTLLNGRLVQGRARLDDGDKIRIGSQEIGVFRRTRVKAETLIDRPVTVRLEAFGVLGRLADKALAMGNGPEAERIIGKLLESNVDDAEAGHALDSEAFVKVSGYALALAQATRKQQWLDCLFRIYGAHMKLMDAELINELYNLVRKIQIPSRTQLVLYIEGLREAGLDKTPTDRFLVGRLEGLVKALG